MKNLILKTISLFAFITLIFSCYEGIDDISYVDPGPDMGAPQVTITYPLEGTEVQVLSDMAEIDIKFRVEDDIEIKDITVLFDGTQIAFYDEFIDYRIFTENGLHHGGIGDGEHTVSVIATDYAGNSTTQTITFFKSPPYTPMYEGEMFYMPFEGDFVELVSISYPETVGNPTFAGQGHASTNSFTAPGNSYLQFPIEQLEGNLTTSFSATFWYNVSGDPDRAGILVIGNEEGGESRNQGFRLFREGSGSEQRIKLNVGTGNTESWNDGGVLPTASNDWVHVAVTVSPTESKIYFDGVEQMTSTLAAPIDWTGAENITIGSGGPTFSYWNHLSDSSWMDDLRLFGLTLTPAQIAEMAGGAGEYEPVLESETFYMPFDGSFKEINSSQNAVPTGNPGFAGTAYSGSDAFKNNPDSWLNYPIAGLFGQEFSTTFWYKVSGDPDRAGILVVGDAPENRNVGFRVFREGSATEQRIKLNVGTGSGESWNDGGVIDVTADQWVHIAVTVSASESKIYFNGELVNTAAMASPVDWTGTSEVVIGHGGPTFSYWNHLYDSSTMDELRFYDQALTAEQIQAMQ